MDAVRRTPYHGGKIGFRAASRERLHRRPSAHKYREETIVIRRELLIAGAAASVVASRAGRALAENPARLYGFPPA